MLDGRRLEACARAELALDDARQAVVALAARLTPAAETGAGAAAGTRATPVKYPGRQPFNWEESPGRGFRAVSAPACPPRRRPPPAPLAAPVARHQRRSPASLAARACVHHPAHAAPALQVDPADGELPSPIAVAQSPELSAGLASTPSTPSPGQRDAPLTPASAASSSTDAVDNSSLLERSSSNSLLEANGDGRRGVLLVETPLRAKGHEHRQDMLAAHNDSEAASRRPRGGLAAAAPPTTTSGGRP